MATLTGVSISSSYTSLLKLDGNTDSTAAGNGSNAIQVKTGDNEATPLFLNTDRLGIGGQPSKTLTVKSSGADDGILFLESTGTILATLFQSGDSSGYPFLDLHDGAGDTKPDNVKVRLNSGGDSFLNGGNIGIGATTIQQLLHLEKDDADVGIALTQTGQRSWSFGIDNSDSDRLKIGYSTTIGTNTVATFTESSQLGIGTTPESVLHINTSSSGGIGGKLIIDNQASDADGNGTEISFFNASGASASGVANSRIRSVANGNTNGYSELQFWTYHASEGQRMTLSSDGKLGLATDNPAQGQSTPISDIKLDVAGNQMLSNLSSTNSDESKLFFFRSDGAVGSQGAVPDGLKIGAIEWTALTSGDDNNSITSARIEVEAGSTWSSASNRNADITFSTVGANTLAERMRLDANSRISLSNNGGLNNTTFGYLALNSATANVAQNIAIGHETLKAMDGTETGNVALGYQAMLSVDENVNSGSGTNSANFNVAIGYQALTGGQFSDANDSNNKNLVGNVAIGANALDATGTNVVVGAVAIGQSALGAMTSGAGNTAVGYISGAALTTGGYNTFVGDRSGDATDDGNYNVALGYSSLSGNCGNSNTALGMNSLAVTTASSNTAVGYYAGNQISSGDNNVAIGHLSIGTATTTGSNNVAVGRQTLEDATSATDNTAVGHQAGANIVTGNTNVAVGRNALVLATACSDVVSIGAYSMDAVTTSTDVNGSVAIGKNSLSAVTDGSANVAVGSFTGQNITGGDNNTIIGHLANYAGGDVHQTTAIGTSSLANATGNNNTALGYNSGDVITSGSSNTLIGYAADPSANDATNQTVIGASAVGIADNSVTLGNTATTQVYVAPHDSEGGPTQQLVFRDNADKGIINYDHNNGMFKITVEGVEHSRFASGGDLILMHGGVNFLDAEGTSASADANTLDDYEEGSFTPITLQLVMLLLQENIQRLVI